MHFYTYNIQGSRVATLKSWTVGSTVKYLGFSTTDLLRGSYVLILTYTGPHKGILNLKTILTNSLFSGAVELMWAYYGGTFELANSGYGNTKISSVLAFVFCYREYRNILLFKIDLVIIINTKNISNN